MLINRGLNNGRLSGANLEHRDQYLMQVSVKK